MNSIFHKSFAWSLVCSSNVDIDSSVCSRADILTESFIRLASMYHLLYSELNFQKTALINLLIVVLKSFLLKVAFYISVEDPDTTMTLLSNFVCVCLKFNHFVFTLLMSTIKEVVNIVNLLMTDPSEGIHQEREKRIDDKD